ncbi:hypothetical protein K493DRAFT_315679 [Basidiobolus meristosporus CBS 931.73]|uniref:Uncharacterized protein n=1 Tax=Basidiobolus meristosporus CBS 931.73 TaxID=1314790 RepID=A0A1Y1Y7R6_9FUNG|nr:hypothetical protein K493DRAFT_315679 [Basidiobolus meristosporus CBS 931.73]|eukprot:ORX94051.1 hypothetical protein K493DRAFT_315679 [Basidiobolus meristosporus CBS 931.73]
MNSWTTNVFRRVFASTRGNLSKTKAKPNPSPSVAPTTNTTIDSEERRELVYSLLSAF